MAEAFHIPLDPALPQYEVTRALRTSRVFARACPNRRQPPDSGHAQPACAAAARAPRHPPGRRLCTRASLGPASLRAYQAGWQAFTEWCQLAGRAALPATPETVADYLATTLSRASLTKRLAAIGQYHRLANQAFSGSHPVIHHTLRGINRGHGRPARRSAALATPEIKRLVAACRTRSLADLRDRALLLLGYAGALRRAKLVAVAREHVSFTPEGLRL